MSNMASFKEYVLRKCSLNIGMHRMLKFGLLALVVFAFMITLFPSKEKYLRKWHSIRETSFASKSNFIKTDQLGKDESIFYLNRTKVFKVLLWTRFFGDLDWTSFHGDRDPSCPYRCNFTHDKTTIKDSDVVLFNVRNLQHVKPSELPMKKRKYNQVWVLFDSEPATKCYLDLTPWNNIFNWTSMVRKDSDIAYSYSTAILLNETRKGQKNMWTYTIPPGNENRNPQNFAAWLVSNCFTQSLRQELVYQLQTYIPVNTYGNCGTHSCSKNTASCDRTIQNHTFYFAFENSICRDYVTEKLWEGLKRGMIPVALGWRDAYTSLAPAGSYIHVDDFTTIEDLTRYLIQLKNNATLQQPYFEWRKHYAIVKDYWCEFCEHLHRWNGTRQWYTDLNGWHSQDTCSYRLPPLEYLMTILQRVYFLVKKQLNI